MSDSTLGAWRFVLADGQEIIFSNVTGVDLGQNEEGDERLVVWVDGTLAAVFMVSALKLATSAVIE